MEKRYYWLKLKEDFFRNIKIKKLRKVAGGDTFTIIYLKMQLLSLKNQGVLEYQQLEETFEDELALELDEDINNVKMTVAYLISNGLLEEVKENQFLLSETVENLDSETEGAKRIRKYRKELENKKEALQCNGKALQCNNNVQLCNKNVTLDIDIDIDKEKDIDKDKEIDIDKELEKEKKENIREKQELIRNGDKMSLTNGDKMSDRDKSIDIRDKSIDIDKDKELEKECNQKVTKGNANKISPLEIVKSFFDDEEIVQSFSDYIENRKFNKSPMSNIAVIRACKELLRLSDDRDEQLAILNQSILNNWRGLFKLKDSKQIVRQESKYVFSENDNKPITEEERKRMEEIDKELDW